MEALWEILKSPLKMFSSKKNKSPKFNEDFVFQDIEDSDLTAIRLIKGKFKDVVYCYMGASVSEEGALARLKFGFNILFPASFTVESLTNNEEFNTLMGDILTELIIKEDVYGQTGTFDTEEFDL